jgi:hypothetical protein
MKSTMGDLTDRSNRAEGFAYLPSELCYFILPNFDLRDPSYRCEVVWSIGVSCFPFVAIRASDGAGICGPLDWRESRPAPRPFPSNIFGQILARIPVLPPLFGDRELCLFLVLLGVGVIQRGKLNMRCYVKLASNHIK